MHDLVAKLIHISGTAQVPLETGLDSTKLAGLRKYIAEEVWERLASRARGVAEKSNELFFDLTEVNIYFSAADLPHTTELTYVANASALMTKNYITSPRV
jgi:hypothetical protein